MKNNNLDILITFGQRVKELRNKQKLSQEEFAYLCGLHRTYIGMIERGEKNITLKNINKISEALNLKIDVLFRGING